MCHAVLFFSTIFLNKSSFSLKFKKGYFKKMLLIMCWPKIEEKCEILTNKSRTIVRTQVTQQGKVLNLKSNEAKSRDSCPGTIISPLEINQACRGAFTTGRAQTNPRPTEIQAREIYWSTFSLQTYYFVSTVKYGSNEHAFNKNSSVKKWIFSPLTIFFFISIMAAKKFACNKQIWMSLQFR